MECIVVCILLKKKIHRTLFDYNIALFSHKKKAE